MMRRTPAPAAPTIVTLLALVAGGCSAPPPPEPVAGDDAYGAAVARATAGDAEGAMTALAGALDADPEACQRALLEPAFHAQLRDREAFRSAVHDAAVRHAISRLALAPEGEPGEWIEVDGRVVDAGGAPVPGAVVRVFATDAAGRYHPTIEGERIPRLFGTLVTDGDGRFTLHTVRPGPYPGTRNARHLHVAVRAGARRLAAPQYVVFDDDPLLHEPQNAEQRGEALRIAMQTVDGRARGTLVLPVR